MISRSSVMASDNGGKTSQDDEMTSQDGEMTLMTLFGGWMTWINDLRWQHDDVKW